MAIWDASLIAVWHLEETASPRVAAFGGINLGNTVVAANDPTSATGQLGTAASWPTGANYAALGYTGAALDVTTTDSFSISFWCYPTDRADYRTLVNDRGNGTRKIYLLALPTTGELVNYNHLNSGYILALGAWQHVVYTYASGGTNTGTEIFYVDGVQRATRTGAVPTPGTGREVGNDTSGGWHVWNGRIDEVALTRRVWTPTEVGQLYNGGAGLAYPNEPAVATKPYYAARRRRVAA